MNARSSLLSRWSALLALLSLPVVAAAIFAAPLLAQQAELQSRVADLKESMAKNKQELAQYTWVETVTIFLKGEQKKQQHYQVRLGPDGKPQKTSLDTAAAPEDQSGGRRGGRVKQHVIEKKKEEYQDYAERMKSLISRYVPPDRDAIQAAVAAGNVSLAPEGGGSTLVKLAIKDYVKPGDNVTLIFDKAQKQLEQYAVATYLDDPSDAIKLTVNFDRIPSGPSHVSGVIVESVAKQLKIQTDNSQYSKL